MFSAKNTVMVSVLILLLAFAVQGYAMGKISEWELIKTKPELELNAVSNIPGTIIVPDDEFYKMENTISLESDNAGKKSDNTWNILKYRNVSISFAHLVIQQLNLDAQKISGDRNATLDAIKSLPSMVFTSSYRDTFESIGKIFEPQVNLRIEF